MAVLIGVVCCRRTPFTVTIVVTETKIVATHRHIHDIFVATDLTNADPGCACALPTATGDASTISNTNGRLVIPEN